MKQTLLTFKSGLLTKLLLSFTLLLAGVGNILADEYLFNGSLAEGWSVNYSYSSGDLAGATYGSTIRTYTSSSAIKISSGQVIKINAQRNTTSGAINSLLRIKYYDGESWQTAREYTTSDFAANQTYYDFESSDIVGEYEIQFEFFAVAIKSIILVDAPVLATLSIFPDEDVSFGTVWANATKTDYYTITNNSASSVNVTAVIGGTDASSFTVSPSDAQDIESGETLTYSISYTYDSSSLDSKTATITFTPDEDKNNAITKNITATAISDNAPQLSVSPDDDTDLGSVYSGDVTYTVTNTGTGLMTVNISSDNGDFVLDKSSITDLANGESGTFKVTYTFDETAEKLGVNSANITVTPTYTGGVAKTYQVTATSNASFVFDENNPSSNPGYGTKSYVHLKYSPSNGWNTLSMPFVLYNSSQEINYMDAIFGEGWKAYTLNAYNNGTLTFKKVSASDNVQYATPHLVYIETALSHPNGVLLQNVYTQGNTPGSTTKGDATFHGTYTTKTYNSLTDEASPWYGVTPVGKVMKAGSGASVKGYRAYFTGVSAPASGVKMMILEGDDETDLGFVKMVDENAKDVYTLTGQKVQKGRKGIYIVNGKKVVIK